MSGSIAEDTRPAVGLTWAIKRRFIAYLARLPDGSFSVDDGATRGDGDAFTFPPLADIRPGIGLPLRFGGVLRLSGHMGMMHVKIATPTIQTSGSGIVITIADPEDEAPDVRIPFAKLILPEPLCEEGFVTWAGIDATLTREGSEIFGEQYGEGEPLEKIDIRLPLEAAARI